MQDYQRAKYDIDQFLEIDRGTERAARSQRTNIAKHFFNPYGESTGIIIRRVPRFLSFLGI
jgi:hypothetical protein